MFYLPAFSFSSGYPLGFGFLAGLCLLALCQFQPFLASSARPACASSFCFRSAVRLRSILGLAAGANRSVKPTRLRRAAYFRSLACEKPALFSPMFYSPAFTFSSVYSLGFGFLAGLCLLALRQFSAFLQAVRRLSGTLLFRSLHTSSIQKFLFLLLWLTVQSSRPAFGGRLTFVR